MKNIVFVFFLLSMLKVWCQDNPIIIVRKDLTVDSTYLKLVTDQELATEYGQIPLNKIQEVNFIKGFDSRLTNVYKLLEDNGVEVRHEQQDFDPSTWGKWSPPSYVEGYLNGNTPINDINVEYARIVGTEVWLSNKVTIEIEFGQRRSVFESALVTDINGKPLKFYSMIGALNFMHKNGFEFITAYALTENNQHVYHYLLQKRK